MNKRALLTVSQAAARLGVNPQTLRRWADAGRVQVVRTPTGQRRFEPEVIARLLREMGVGGHEEETEHGEESV